MELHRLLGQYIRAPWDMALPRLISYVYKLTHIVKRAEFVRDHHLFAPNGSISVTEVQTGDVVFLDGHPCEVTKVSKPFSTTGPLDLDKSSDPKKAIVITGTNILWPKVVHDPVFHYDDSNKIKAFCGVPEFIQGELVFKIYPELYSLRMLTYAFAAQL